MNNRKTMADINLDKVESFLNVHDRWVCPTLSDVKENPEQYTGIVLVDTWTENGEPASMVTPRVLDDIPQIGMEFREISIVSEDDDYILSENEDVQPGHMKLSLRPRGMGLRIKPRTDLWAEKIPRKY